MIKVFFTYLFTFLTYACAYAQKVDSTITDSLNNGYVYVESDYRMELLGKKIAEHNGGLSSTALYKNSKFAKGYRLMVISTSDRAEATKVRTFLLQRYPNQKPYTTFQNPFIKLKFGDYLDRSEAERVKKEILRSGIVKGNVYVIAETINVKPDKTLLEKGNKK